MTFFDKLCAIISIPIGICFLILGVFGLFTGSNANFSLPPVLGFLPFFAGWSMCVTIIRFWRQPSRNQEVETNQQLETDHKIYSEQFRKFLELHPEFQSADSGRQRVAFHRWINNPESR